MSRRSRSKANIPINRESLFWILSPLFWILSPAFCPTRLSCPSCHEFMTLLCKTNPIYSRTKAMQLSLPQRFTEENHPWDIRKNKPNQTQSQPKTRALLDSERPVVSKVEPSRRANQTQFQRHKQLTLPTRRNIAAAIRPKCIIPIHTFFPGLRAAGWFVPLGLLSRGG